MLRPWCLPLLLAACGGLPAAAEGDSLDGGGGDGGEPAATDKLDLLFVIDDSASMAGEQTRLAEQLPLLASTLMSRLPSSVSLHVGVVSTSVGLPIDLFNCEADRVGDGRLQALPGCLTEGLFLVDELSSSGNGRERNSALGLGEAMQCLVRLGDQGCGFEEPMEALHLALEGNPTNDGFLRDDAALLVVILSDEDDCSHSGPGLFDTTETGLDSVLGPMTSYRCTELGVTCAEGAPGRQTASFTGCQPNFDSNYLTSPALYRDFLVEKKGAARVAVMAIVGAPEPFAVARIEAGSPPRVELGYSCQNAPGNDLLPAAVPAVRLTWLTEAFTHHATASICAADYGLGQAVDLAAAAMAGR